MLKSSWGKALLVGLVVLAIGVSAIWQARTAHDAEVKKETAALEEMRENAEAGTKVETERSKIAALFLARLKKLGEESKSSWSGHLIRVDAAGSMTVINTDMKARATNRESFRSLCAAASTLVFRHEYDPLTSEGVTVMGASGQMGALRLDRKSTCGIVIGNKAPK